ncbi:MAG: hypothetical protein GXO85_10675, partial [Chlorobi bacterium]|nr:hypothetical protein [Chlorobiota bacterium]
ISVKKTNYQIVLRTDQYQISADNFTISSGRAFGVDTDSKQLKYFEGKSRSPRLSFERKEKNDLHVGIVEVAKHELPIWTLQSEKPLNVAQTVYGLEVGKKYNLLSDSKVIGEKVADANGSLSFSLKLTDGHKKHITMTAVGLDNSKD